MDKAAIVQELRAQLAAQEQTMRRAADAARDAATHEEAKPENDKDTRALEASYLAGAQAAKARELKVAQNGLAFMPLRVFGADDAIDISARVRIGKKVYFVAPHAGGMKVGEVIVVTPASPVGLAIMGKQTGDIVEIGGREVTIDEVD